MTEKQQEEVSSSVTNNVSTNATGAAYAASLKEQEKEMQQPQQSQEQENLSLSERYEKAIGFVCNDNNESSSSSSAIPLLEQIQHEIARLALFSSNESLQDISTKSLPLLALEHYLALAYMRVPTGPGKLSHRKTHLIKSMDLWSSFIQRLESLGGNNDSDSSNGVGEDGFILTTAEQKEYQNLMEYTNQFTKYNVDDDNQRIAQESFFPTPKREDKIARFRAKQQAQKQIQHMKSLRERRKRIGIAAEDIMDDYDEESLERTVAITNLMLCKAEALEEWASTLQELPMIVRMVQMEKQQNEMNRHLGEEGGRGRSNNGGGGTNDLRQRPPPAAPSTGLEVTHITLDSNSNQLQFRKEEIKSQVFRPGWNQPTMTLKEFAGRERNDAISREHKQKEAEANVAAGGGPPRRYEQLVRDGLEDDSNAVDASAAVDRAWDNWKDENPRGSGNKRGDQGDRNF